MTGKNKSTVQGIIIGVILVALVLGYYFYLSNRKADTPSEETTTSISAVQNVLLRDLTEDYPPSPREVLKYYSDITVCFYSEEYTDEEFEKLALQIQKLYDDELVANSTQEQYLNNLKWDINNMKEQNMTVSSYSVASSTDVFYFEQDGYQWARLNGTFTLRSGKEVGLCKEVFVLRKDSAGHWKIYGWKRLEENEQ